MADGSRNRIVLAVVVLATVALALAALLVSGPAATGPGNGAGRSGTPTAPGQLTIDLPPQVWGLLFLSPLLVGFVGVLLRRGVVPRSRGLLSVVVVLLLALMFYALLQHGSGGPGAVSFQTGGSGGTNDTNQTNGTNHTNGTAGGGTGVAAFNFQLPAYAVWVVAALLGTLVLVLAIPGVVGRIADRRRGPTGGARPVDREAVVAAFAQAAGALDRGEDPRATVVRLYTELLFRLAPVAGEMASSTPEEIRRQYLVALGVPEAPAATLTRLFEEARYSTHPIDAASAARVRDAVRIAGAALRTGAAA